jgi:tRNA pseudouridine32 synthase/23S rRNA pseudouridine746 synthase
MTALDLLPRLLHRDGLMLIIDKPAGVAVHRGPKGGPCLEDAFEPLRFGLPRLPALAHRLDRDTSGCLVLGRHRKALERLGRLFKTGRIGKTYWAVVEGQPAADDGEIDLALGRLDATRGWWMRPDPRGLPARTGWRVLGRTVDERLAFIEFTPHTGRTHQIRVHAQAMGWPLLGDPIYGRGEAERAPPLHLHLHARAIVVPMQDGKPPVRAEAPVPAHMRDALALCGLAPDLPMNDEQLTMRDYATQLSDDPPCRRT